MHESEIGHIHEIDDTPGGARLLTTTYTGTFHRDTSRGDKVVKEVVGEKYEIVIQRQKAYS